LYDNVPEYWNMHNNLCRPILQLAKVMLLGEFNYRKENYDIAFDYLKEAVIRGDNLFYDEPSGNFIYIYYIFLIIII
jgi:hypothetical protein